MGNTTHTLGARNKILIIICPKCLNIRGTHFAFPIGLEYIWNKKEEDEAEEEVGQEEEDVEENASMCFTSLGVL